MTTRRERRPACAGPAGQGLKRIDFDAQAVVAPVSLCYIEIENAAVLIVISAAATRAGHHGAKRALAWRDKAGRSGERQACCCKSNRNAADKPRSGCR